MILPRFYTDVWGDMYAEGACNPLSVISLFERVDGKQQKRGERRKRKGKVRADERRQNGAWEKRKKTLLLNLSQKRIAQNASR
jgi:hypothetical protein